MSVFNAAPYVQAAVDSILNQSYSDYEFIIIDDGSTDQSPKLLRAYTDPRITLLTNDQNIGLTLSLNRGLAVARGRYVARMDADDISLPDRFKRQIEFLDLHPEIDVLGTHMEIISKDGQGIGQYSVPTTHGAIIWSLLFGLAIAHPTVFIRRDALMRVGGYSSDVLRAQDFALWTEMSKTSRFANLPEVLHQYRSQSGMISQKHAAEQTTTLLQCRQQLFSRILIRDIPLDLVECAYRSQLKPSEIKTFLTDEQVLQVMSLMLSTFENLCQQNIITPDEQDSIRQDMLQRMMVASRCTAKFQRTVINQKYSLLQRLKSRFAMILKLLSQWLNTSGKAVK